MKLEYRQMGLTEEEAQRFVAARELLEKTIKKFESEAGPVLRNCCSIHSLFFATLKQSCEFILFHGGEMVTLKRTTYQDLEEQITNCIKVMEAIITDVSGEKTKQDAHKAVEEDAFVKVNMQAPAFKS